MGSENVGVQRGSFTEGSQRFRRLAALFLQHAEVIVPPRVFRLQSHKPRYLGERLLRFPQPLPLNAQVVPGMRQFRRLPLHRFKLRHRLLRFARAQQRQRHIQPFPCRSRCQPQRLLKFTDGLFTRRRVFIKSFAQIAKRRETLRNLGGVRLGQ